MPRITPNKIEQLEIWLSQRISHNGELSICPDLTQGERDRHDARREEAKLVACQIYALGLTGHPFHE